MVVPDGDIVAIEHGKASELADRVEVVVQDGNFHRVFFTVSLSLACISCIGSGREIRMFLIRD